MGFSGSPRRPTGSARPRLPLRVLRWWWFAGPDPRDRRARAKLPAYWWLIPCVLAVGIVIWAALWPLTDALAEHDVGNVATAATRTLRLQSARESVRTQLLTLGAGLGALGALVFTGQNYLLSRQGQVTDRYSRAIEQLGSDKLDVRIGGIYALERVARDSPKRDHPTVMEVLGAFIREHSREPLSGAVVAKRRHYPPSPQTRPVGQLRPDVQAAISVIGRRNAKADVRILDLASTSLQRAFLTDADLAGADLSYADLADANLGGANLAHAYLTGADLARAFLGSADLAGAYLPGADLTGAYLTCADLTDANLTDANLTGADLTRAQLAGANLTGAQLAGANLTGAQLARADLTRADLTGANLFDANLADADLTLAELAGVNLSGAKLTAADLKCADLTARTDGANLTQPARARPELRGPDRRAPDRRGPDPRGPDRLEPDRRGPDRRGPDRRTVAGRSPASRRMDP